MQTFCWSPPTRVERFHPVSQTILVAGFTKKFGKPDSTKAKTVRTGMGVEYEQTVVVWTDTQGNRLELMSIFDTVNAGVIILESAEHIKRSAQERMEEEKKKKF